MAGNQDLKERRRNMIGLLIQLIIVLIIVGLLLWLVQSYLPVPPMIKSVINIVMVLIVILYLLRMFGIVHV
jgi:hypothetical protein